MHFKKALKIINYGNIAYDRELAFNFFVVNHRHFEKEISFEEFYRNLGNNKTIKNTENTSKSKEDIITEIYGERGESYGI